MEPPATHTLTNPMSTWGCGAVYIHTPSSKSCKVGGLDYLTPCERSSVAFSLYSHSLVPPVKGCKPFDTNGLRFVQCGLGVREREKVIEFSACVRIVKMCCYIGRRSLMGLGRCIGGSASVVFRAVG